MRLDTESVVDLFIKTWSGDAKWLPYCLAGHSRYARDFRQLVLITDKGFDFEISETNIPIKIIETDPTEAGYTENPAFWGVTRQGKITENSPRGPGYYWQQAVKMSWPEYSDADAVVILDTDVIAWDKFCAMDFTMNGQPYWRTEPYKTNDNDLIWKNCVESFLGESVCKNYMLKYPDNPYLFTREATIGFAAQIRERYDLSIIDFFRPTSDGLRLSEFSLFGAYLDRVNRHGYIIVDFDTFIGVPDIPLKQYWSWGGLDPLFEDIDQMIQS